MGLPAGVGAFISLVREHPAMKKGKPSVHPSGGQSKTSVSVSLSGPLAWLLAPQHMFAILALLFGSAFIVTTPPFQVPDEAAHFFRTFSLSEFVIAQEVSGTKTGDFLPASLDSTAAIFNYLRFVPDNKVPKGQIRSAMEIRLDPAVRTFIPVSAGNYIYPSYIPQLPAVWIGKLLGLNVLTILYLGRFLALLFYVACVWYAIRVIPVGGFLLLVVALMPMCLAQAGSFSPDSVTFAFSFFTLAVILKYALGKEPAKLNVESGLALFMLLVMGILKPVFLPIVLLLFLLPPDRFAGRQRYWIITLGTTGLATLLAIGWLKLMASFGTLQANVDINGRPIDPSGKVSQLIRDPFRLVGVVMETLGYFGKMYYQSLIGILGYLDTRMPGWIYAAFSSLGAALTIFEGRKGAPMLFWQRLLLFGVSFSVFLGTILALYLFTREKSNLVAEGGQGRYFIPVLFTFLMAFYSLSPARTDLGKNILARAVLYILLVMLLVVVEITLHARYFE